MSRKPITALRPVVEQLLLDVVADGFAVYCCGDRTGPTALVASYEWADYIDVVTIRNFERITAARIPINTDVFAPEAAVWSYEGPTEWTLRALLNLVHPKHPDAPTATYPAPRSLHIPRAEQRPMTIRPRRQAGPAYEPPGSPPTVLWEVGRTVPAGAHPRTERSILRQAGLERRGTMNGYVTIAERDEKR